MGIVTLVAWKDCTPRWCNAVQHLQQDGISLSILSENGISLSIILVALFLPAAQQVYAPCQLNAHIGHSVKPCWCLTLAYVLQLASRTFSLLHRTSLMTAQCQPDSRSCLVNSVQGPLSRPSVHVLLAFQVLLSCCYRSTPVVDATTSTS